MKEKPLVTRSGFLRLVDKLHYLKHVVRPGVIEELQEARAFGVNIYNSQYMLAREKHRLLERKIQELEEKISHSEILVGCRFYVRRVFIGTVVDLENVDTGEVNRYTIVGPLESDVSNGKLASNSPVGSAILGKFEGDVVKVKTPSGTRIYRIVAIENLDP
ncbi:MAG: transcription elongation factor GreA [Deltaproteobacteria bacterium]|nr:transcription elongation factor GreA [Deltaproteobacteria bacterium]MBW2067273.1 transcription elongation factor GreA [Deltaproteobacteria bacterium]